MQFAWDWMLPLLLLVPLLIILYVVAQRRRARYALRYSSLLIVQDALKTRPGWRRHIPPLLFLLSIAAMLIAAARPQAVTVLPKQEATVILVIDVSGSMRAEDLKPNRLEAAKAAARLFVDRQEQNTRVGVVAFSANASVVQMPTTDKEAVLEAINRLTIGRSTAIGSGILTALNAIFGETDAPATTALDPTPGPPAVSPTPVPSGFHVPAIIVLLTDGQNVVGAHPLAAAQEAAERGVRVFAIGAGTKQGTTVRGPGGSRSGFRTELDEETLQMVSQMTDGKYFHASDENALNDIYQNLDTQLILRTERTEVTFGFTALAMLFSLIGAALSLAWFNRLP